VRTAAPQVSRSFSGRQAAFAGLVLGSFTAAMRAFVAFGAAQKVCPPRVVEHEVPFHTGVEDVDAMLTDIRHCIKWQNAGLSGADDLAHVFSPCPGHCPLCHP